MSELEKHFTDIYRQNAWHGTESKSGTGSDLSNTQLLRTKLVTHINWLKIDSVIDAPCGDFNWMSKIVHQMKIKNYFGVDIVNEIIEKNILTYADANFLNFKKMDVVNEILPKADLIFSRDCLVHFSYETAKKIIRNFVASGATYVLMTTFTKAGRNYFDIKDGEWRAINFNEAPMNLPLPMELINEGCTEDRMRWTDKCLGLWKLEQLREI